MPQEDSIEEMICELNFYKDTIQIALNSLNDFCSLEPALTKRQDRKLSDLMKTLQDYKCSSA